MRNQVKEIIEKWYKTFEEEYRYLIGDEVLKKEKEIVDYSLDLGRKLNIIISKLNQIIAFAIPP